MNGLFIGILNMSLGAGCAALIVMPIRLALRKAPKIYSYALWAVVLFRLVCPLTIPTPVSAVPVRPQTIPQDIVTAGTPAVQSGVAAADRAVNEAMESSLRPARPENSVNPAQIALEIGKCLWLAGALALLLHGFVSYLRLKKRVATATRVKDNIYETDLIKTPFVLGFVRARIYVPTGLGEKEAEYVLEHERAHIRRLDHLVRPFAFLVACTHWFNPIVWVSYALMARDMEMAADESVMKRSDADIRSGYSVSILALSARKSGLLSPLAFGETGVKQRVKNVLRYKKPALWASAAAALAVAAVSLSLACSAQPEPASKNPPDRLPDPKSASATPLGTPGTSGSTEYDGVRITFLSDTKGYKSAGDEFETTEPNTVAAIDSSLAAGLTPAQQSGLVNNHTDHYAIKLYNDAGESGWELYYDTLYGKAYLSKDGGLWQIDTDFARYIGSFLENRAITLTVDKDASALFRQYGWTLDYRINATAAGLDDIRSLSGFEPNAYYFAYNNELSRDIGLDMSAYSGTAGIGVDIYRIRESMPQEFHPILDCRGIVLKCDGKIIGAYISAGRHSTFNACSLKGNGFEKAAGKPFAAWLAERVKPDAAEERLSRAAPEQIIREYFTALDNKDAGAAERCVSKQALLENLTVNMPNEELFNEAVGLPLTQSADAQSVFDNLKSAKLLKVEPIDEAGANAKAFRVYVDLQYNYVVTTDSGEQSWDCKMVYESPQTGWKIDSFGH